MSYTSPDEDEQRGDLGGAEPGRDRLDEPVVGAMDPGDDPRGWNRASITLWSHPLHPRPRLTQEDLLLPRHTDRLRALGDAAVFAVCLIGLSFFPLYIAYIVLPGLSHWYWTSAFGVGLAGGVWVFFRSLAISPEAYLEHYEPS